MDLREMKTQRNIRNAFLQLRSEKPLERIRVKELAELAEISKGTFYLHFHDVYDLSEQLQDEVIQNVMNSIDHPDAVLNDQPKFTHELFQAFLAHQNLIHILFSGSQESVLPGRIEQELRKLLLQRKPDALNDAYTSVSLTYQVYGGYFAFQEHLKNLGCGAAIQIICEISGKISVPEYQDHTDRLVCLERM